MENLGWKMLSRISNLGGGKFVVENVISKFLNWGGVENLGWKMLSRTSNLGVGKFGVENAISNLEFGVWKIWGGKCYLESRIWGVENLGWKMLLETPIWVVENLGWKI